MNISIVIPNYNGEQIMKENLPHVVEAVEGYRKGNVEIIIPDDASKDNSLTMLYEFKKKYEKGNIKIKIITNKQNQGFSGNVMSGVSVATGEILILLNSDVSPHKDFLEPLLAHFDDSSVFAVGCMDESIEEGKIVLRGRGVGKWSRGFMIHSAGSLDKNNSLWAGGGSSAFNKKIWDKIGGLNTIYNPFYWEDIDLSYRAHKAGYKVIFESKSIVIHRHTTGAIKKNITRSKVTKIAYRNQFFFVWLNITDLDLIISHIIWLPYHLFIALLHHNIEFLVGFVFALTKIFQVFAIRRKVRKLFKKTDRAIFAEFV